MKPEPCRRLKIHPSVSGWFAWTFSPQFLALKCEDYVLADKPEPAKWRIDESIHDSYFSPLLVTGSTFTERKRIVDFCRSQMASCMCRQRNLGKCVRGFHGRFHPQLCVSYVYWYFQSLFGFKDSKNHTWVNFWRVWYCLVWLGMRRTLSGFTMSWRTYFCKRTRTACQDLAQRQTRGWDVGAIWSLHHPWSHSSIRSRLGGHHTRRVNHRVGIRNSFWRGQCE